MNDPPTWECEEVLRVIFAYVDGELEREDHQRVEEHLERCRSCFSRAEFEGRLKGHLAGLARPSVPPAFEHRIRTLIGRFARPGAGDGPRPEAQDA